jgi:putative aldouronate transport system substrate-binding protein
MEPRAKLRLERLDAYVTPYIPDGVTPTPNLLFTLEELNVLSSYENNLNDYIRTNMIKWLMGGGVSDSEWATFQTDLNGRTHLNEIQQVYQDAYDRYIANS